MTIVHRPNNFILLKCTNESFFRMWIEFLTPFHRLSMREKDVVAVIISQYFKLKAQCNNADVVRKLLWTKTSKKDMEASLGISQEHFNVITNKLKKSKIIIGGDINPRYLPHIEQDSNTFELRVVFDYSTPNRQEAPIHEIVKN